MRRIDHGRRRGRGWRVSVVWHFIHPRFLPLLPSFPLPPLCQRAGASCWICYEGAQDANDALVNLCACRGSCKWVHTGCISKWIEEWRRAHGEAIVCPQCRQPYRILEETRAPRWVQLYESVTHDLTEPFYRSLMVFGCMAASRVYGYFTIVSTLGNQPSTWALMEELSLWQDYMGVGLIPAALLLARTSSSIAEWALFLLPASTLPLPSAEDWQATSPAAVLYSLPFVRARASPAILNTLFFLLFLFPAPVHVQQLC